MPAKQNTKIEKTTKPYGKSNKIIWIWAWNTTAVADRSTNITHNVTNLRVQLLFDADAEDEAAVGWRLTIG